MNKTLSWGYMTTDLTIIHFTGDDPGLVKLPALQSGKKHKLDNIFNTGNVRYKLLGEI